MITFLEGQTYYATPDNVYYSRPFETGPYNKIVMQRIDECPVGPVSAELTLETANNPAAASWVALGEGIPSGISTRTSLARFVRVALDIQATASPWQDGFYYDVDVLASSNSKVWTCSVAHTASVDDEPEGTDSSQGDWMDSQSYSVGNLVQGVGAQAGVCYYCTQAHTSSSTDEPGEGANWQSYWVLNYARYWSEYDEVLYTRISVYGRLVSD